MTAAARTPDPAVTYAPDTALLITTVAATTLGSAALNASPEPGVAQGSATITTGGTTVPVAQTPATAVVLTPGQVITITASPGANGYTRLLSFLNDDNDPQACITSTATFNGPVNTVFTVTAPTNGPTPCGLEGFVLYESTANPSAGLFTPIFVQVLPS